MIQFHRVTGDPCVIMRAAVDSMPHLEDLINRIAQFGFSKTSIVLSTAVERSLPSGHLVPQGRQESSKERKPLKARADA